MNQTFFLVKYILLAALSVALSAVLLDVYAYWNGAAAVLLSVFMLAWLMKHPGQVRQDYEDEENRYLKRTVTAPDLFGLNPWRLKPRYKDIAFGLIFVGLVCFYFAYEVAHGGKPSRTFKLLFSLYGAKGVVFVWCVGGVCCIAQGLQSFIATRHACKPT